MSNSHLGRLLLRALRHFEAELTSQLQQRGYPEIRPAHSAVFAHLERTGTRPSELARRAGMTKQSMGELIADLEALGYVERRADPSDRRARVVALTEAGRRLDRLAGRVIREIEISYRRRMGNKRMDPLLEGLAEIAKSPNEPDEALPPRRGRGIDSAPR